jgi:hypothetical protein
MVHIKKKMPGVSIVELLLVITLTSIIMTGLLVVLQQSFKLRNTIDSTVSFRTRIAVIQEQFTRDFLGLTVPVFSVEMASAAENEKKETEQKESPEAAPAQEKEGQKEKSKEKIVFYASSRDNNNLDMVSFITLNSLSARLDQAVGTPATYIARVIYRLLPDERRPNSFTLFREERADLNKQFDKVQQGSRMYEVASGIAQLSLVYVFVIEEEVKAGAAGAKEKEKQQKKIENMHIWQPTKDKKLPLFPHYIKMDLSLWSRDFKKQEKVTLYFELPLDSDKKLFEKQAAKSEQQPKQQTVPPKAPQQPANNRPPRPQLSNIPRPRISSDGGRPPLRANNSRPPLRVPSFPRR